jgi:C-terminal processing protease CtpA/Prc
MRPMLRSLSAFLMLVVSITAGAAQPDARIQRLQSVAKLWGTVKYFHPYVAYRDVDWDAALVEALPKINAAQTPEQFADAVQFMLGRLNDPATAVVKKSAPKKEAAAGEAQPYSKMVDGVLVITMNDAVALADWQGVRPRFKKILADLKDAKAVVVDLRAPSEIPETARGYMSGMFDDYAIGLQCTTAAIASPGQRGRMYSGYPSGAGSGGYYGAFYVKDGSSFAPDNEAKERPVVFLVNEYTEIPATALALQAAGKAAILSEGAPTDAASVESTEVKLADGVVARVRTTEVIDGDGSVGVQADGVVPAGEAAMQRALELARDFKVLERKRTPAAARALFRPDKAYAENPYPSAEYRVLSAVRIWNIFHYFFAYKALMGEDWEGVLAEFLPRLEQAKDAKEYHLAVAEMVNHVHDNHAFVASKVISDTLAGMPPAVDTRFIEGKLVVTGFRDAEAAKKAGVAVGDVIVTIGDEDAIERARRYQKYYTSANEWTAWRNAARWMMNGPEKSEVTLVVKGKGGRERRVKLPRSQKYFDYTERSGEVVKLLVGNIGYVDLDRLDNKDVDGMFEKLKDTKAIVFDMRGYPHGTAWSIAPRLAKAQGVGAARFYRPLLTQASEEGDDASSATFTFVQHLPVTDKPRYAGRTVMLIDERTQSQAEHTGLFFEAANGTKFIGSPTAGSNGDVTSFSVPGGIRIGFSGHDVRHVDGRQLQRVGLKPDVEVRPTIAGIRAGKDEVLEKAVAYLNAGEKRKAPPVAAAAQKVRQ